MNIFGNIETLLFYEVTHCGKTYRVFFAWPRTEADKETSVIRKDDALNTLIQKTNENLLTFTDEVNFYGGSLAVNNFTIMIVNNEHVVGQVYGGCDGSPRPVIPRRDL